jgi:hypothetical protein
MSGSGTPAGRRAAFDQLSEAKHDHDPGHVLTPGYEVF